MRDPKRIGPIMSLLQKYWEKHPDLRLGQVIANLTPPYLGNDPFYMEDDELEQHLLAQLQNS